MAKQKKKKKKVHLSSADKNKYSIILSVIIISMLMCMNFSKKLYYFALEIVNGKNIFYAEPKINFSLIATGVLFLIGFIIVISWHSGAISLKLPFNEYFSMKSKKAKVHLKKYIVIVLAWFVLITSCFWISTFSCFTADEDGLTEKHIFSNDNITYAYSEIDNVNIHLDYAPLTRANGFIISTSHYELILDIEAKGKTYQLTDDWFDKDYVKVEKLLSNISKEKISIDKSNFDEFYKNSVSAKSEKNKTAITRIFNYLDNSQ